MTKDEMDKLFPKTVPVLATSDILLETLCYEGVYKRKNTEANEMYYRKCKHIERDENKLGRIIISLFRNSKYNIKDWPNYADYIRDEVLK